MRLARLWKLACIWSLLAAFAAAQGAGAVGQESSKGTASSSAASEQKVKPDKAQAYYHFSLGHLYQERGILFNRPDLLSRAVDEYELALKNDPTSSYLSLQLARLYASTGEWQSALQQAEDDVQSHPDDLSARKLLGRLYLRLLVPQPGEQQPPAGLKARAVKQFEQILQRDPNDISSYLILSQLYRAAGHINKAEATLKQAVAMQPDSVDANSALALFYVDLGNYQAAISLLKKIANPKADARVWSTLAYAYQQIQDYKDAASAYNQAVDRSPNNLAYRRGLGQSLLLSKQYDQAQKQFQALVNANPHDVESYLRLSQAYRLQRKYDLAQQNLTTALELAPDNLDVQFNQVLLVEMEGKLPEAISLTQKILDASAKENSAALSPQEKTNRGIFLEKLGLLYREQGNFAEAADTFSKMLALGQDNAIRGNLHLIETYEQDQRYDKALQTCEKALKQYPKSNELIFEHASLLASSGKGAAGIALLKPLLKNTAGDRAVWLAMARVYEQERQFDQARQATAKAEALSNASDEKEYIHFLYGSIWERQKHYKRAEEEFRKALAVNPDSAMTLNYLGYMWADQGVHLDEAVKYIQHALELEPNSGAYMDSLGWAYYRQNRLDLAEQYLQKAVERMGSDPTILDHLGEVYYSTGRIREAQEKWKLALTEWNRLPKNEVDRDEFAKVQKKLKESLKVAENPSHSR